MEQTTLIDILGGPTVVARALGHTPNAVANWKSREIPWRWRPALAELARAKGVPVSPEFLGL